MLWVNDITAISIQHVCLFIPAKKKSTSFKYILICHKHLKAH